MAFMNYERTHSFSNKEEKIDVLSYGFLTFLLYAKLN